MLSCVLTFTYAPPALPLPQERIQVADEAIVKCITEESKKIVDGDVILTYARSHVVEQVLKAAHDLKTRFRVIVADSRPRLEGVN